MSFDAFDEYLKSNYGHLRVDLQKHIFSRIKEIIVDTFMAVRADLNPGRRRHCFELLGYDFLIDEDFRLWLIEVNQNPYLGTPNRHIG